jgi:signal transduction histidine kinase
LIGQTLRRNDRRREIEQQNERLERFASVIGHDLQNPLNVIIGYTELARETSDFEAIDRIEAAADRMETILEDLQTLTREAKDLGDRESIAISEVVERACRTVETEDVTVDIDEIGSVEADSSRLRQAFENLLRNAVEHSGSDVTVRIERIDDGFAVTDDGPGFSPADRGHVFEEGYTGDNGTGLGLAIVRTVIEAHGWTIEATDGDDGGARFEIRGIEFDN